MGLKCLIAAALFAAGCFAQDTEIDGAIGYGVYRDGSIYAPGGKAEAGIRNRFAAGVVLGEDLYDHLSGEIRYLYHDGHAFLSSGGVKTEMQGQSHTFTYDLLFHLKGSVYGLDAASGVVRYLEERGMGFHVGSIIVPMCRQQS